ncbi:MAG: hypothetical protein KDE46_00910 [Caldilineaceae bacterium]|nr:hypothetical protein [Caldilineaceae bacterium]
MFTRCHNIAALFEPISFPHQQPGFFQRLGLRTAGRQGAQHDRGQRSRVRLVDVASINAMLAIGRSSNLPDSVTAPQAYKK